MYSNFPTDELIKIIDSMCIKQGINAKFRHELVRIACTVIKQNYFEFLNTSYAQETVLVIGAPIHNFSEIYL